MRTAFGLSLNIGAWYEREKGKWPMNYGQAVGHEYVRMMVHDGLKFNGPIDAVDVFNNRAAAVKEDEVAGWSITKSSLEQINQITMILDENLRQGAIGIGRPVRWLRRKKRTQPARTDTSTRPAKRAT